MDTDKSTHEDCDDAEARYANIKPLQSVWAEFPQFSERNTLLLDDSPEKAVANPLHTAVHPAPFYYERLPDVPPTDRPVKLNKKAKKRKLLEGQAAGMPLPPPPADPRDAEGSDDTELQPCGALWRYLDAVADAAADNTNAVGVNLEQVVHALGPYRSPSDTATAGVIRPQYYLCPTLSTDAGAYGQLAVA
jgi:hypothetical protein